MQGNPFWTKIIMPHLNDEKLIEKKATNPGALEFYQSWTFQEGFLQKKDIYFWGPKEFQQRCFLYTFNPRIINNITVNFYIIEEIKATKGDPANGRG